MKSLVTRLLGFWAVVMLAAATAALADFVTENAIAIFSNPTGGDPALYTGVGTDTFGWGAAGGLGTGPSHISFAGLPFNTTTETSFLLGTMTYFNGTTVGGEATAVDLDVTLAVAFPNGTNQLFTFTFPLNITTTTNTSDPIASADILTLPTLFPPQTFTIGGVNYTTKLNVFSQASVEGFITNADEVHVFEGGSATADLTAIVTSNIAPVPEPTSLLLLLSSFAGLGGIMWRRKRPAFLRQRPDAGRPPRHHNVRLGRWHPLPG